MRDVVHRRARQQRQRLRLHLEEALAARGKRRDEVSRQLLVRVSS